MAKPEEPTGGTLAALEAAALAYEQYLCDGEDHPPRTAKESTARYLKGERLLGVLGEARAAHFEAPESERLAGLLKGERERCAALLERWAAVSTLNGECSLRWAARLVRKGKEPPAA